jgi:CheY-like chemotaxis protein
LAVEESEKEMQYISPGNAIISVDNASSIPESETERPYILAIDDERAILSLLMSLLESEGYSCVGISESERVLPFLEQIGNRGVQHLPGLILLDLMMPRVSGYDIARWLSEHEPYNSIPVLVITGDPRAHDISDVPGVQDILLKPFEIEALLMLVEHFLAPLLKGS